MGTIKSGTLEKQGGFLWKGWKYKHCVLYQDGEFAIYENATDANAEFRINITSDLKELKNGFDCGPISLPQNRRDTESLFAIVVPDKTYYLLAESPIECESWIDALNTVKDRPSKAPLPPPYSPLEHSQPVRAQGSEGTPEGSSSLSTAVPQQSQQQLPPPQPMSSQQPMYGPGPMYGQPQPMMYGQPVMYGGPPMYGPPMYGQPMYVSQSPYIQNQRNQQQQPRDNSTRNMLLAGGGGLLGGYLLGSTISEMNHHHHTDYGGGGGGGGGDGGGFDHGAFDGGGFDF